MHLIGQLKKRKKMPKQLNSSCKKYTNICSW